MTFLELCRLIISLVVAIIVALSSLWSIRTIQRGGRGFFIKVTSPDGNTSNRLNIKLIEGIFFQLLTLASSIFLICNVVVFVIFNEWAFGKGIGNTALTVIVAYLLFGVFLHFYTYVKDESEKRHEIREVTSSKGRDEQ